MSNANEFREARRTEYDEGALRSIPSGGSDRTACDELANTELLHALRGERTAEERRIARLRADGRSWHEVAAELGGKPQARRMQLARGAFHAARKLGLASIYD